MIFRPRNLIQLSSLYLPINLFWTAMVVLLLPARVAALTSSQKGIDFALVNSSGAIVATLCMFLVGPLSDNTTHRFGRRFPWVVGGLLLGAAGAMLFSLAHSLVILLCAFVMARLGFSAAIAAYEAIIPDRVPVEYQSRASGWNEMFDVMGLFAGLALSALMIGGTTNRLLNKQFSPKIEADVATFLICTGCAVLLITVLLFNLGWIKEKRLLVAKPWKDAIRMAFSWRPSQAPDFAWLFLSRCVLNLGIFTGSDFLAYYVEYALLPKAPERVPHEVLLIAFFYALGGVLGAIIGGRLGDFFPKRTPLYFFCSLAAVAATGFCFTGSLEVARIIAFVYGIGSSAINTIDWAFATSLVPKGHEARYLAIFQTCFYLPQILVGMGGVIGQIYGYRVLFGMIPFWLIIGMLLLSRVRERNEVVALPAT